MTVSIVALCSLAEISRPGSHERVFHGVHSKDRESGASKGAGKATLAPRHVQ